MQTEIHTCHKCTAAMLEKLADDIRNERKHPIEVEQRQTGIYDGEIRIVWAEST